MPHPTLLQFAEQNQFSQVRAFAGEVLYTGGMPAPHLYVVKDGEVDLFLVRDEKRTVIETLGKGQCFGIEPHLARPTRMQGAAARSYCELYVIDHGLMNRAVDQSPELVQGLLNTMSERLTVAHGLIASRVNHQADLLLYAQLLYLMGLADLGKTAVQGRHAAMAVATARPLVQDVYVQARALFGHSDRHIRDCLGKLISLHLVRLDHEHPSGKQLVFAPRDIVGQVRKCLDNVDSGPEKQSYEYIGVDEFAALVDVDRHTLLRKLAGGDFADDVFTFRRSEIVRLLDDKGRGYFAERRVKTAAEFSEIGDIEFADKKALSALVAKMDDLEVARVLSMLEPGPVRERLLAGMSRRRRDDVENDLNDLGPVDAADGRLLCQNFIDKLKKLMLQPA